MLGLHQRVRTCLFDLDGVLTDNRNALFRQTLHSEGVEVLEESRRYLDAVTAAGLGVAVVSSSSNTREVLEVTGLAKYVQVRVDGVTMREEGFPGKPAPDSFLRGAHFGVVIGVDRVGQAEALRRNGAYTVVADLAELLDA